MIVCLAIIALWVRSYWIVDNLLVVNDNCYLYEFASAKGEIWFSVAAPIDNFDLNRSRWEYEGTNIRDTSWPSASNLLGFRLFFGADDYTMLPHWFVAAVVTTIGAAPWLRWRFSLRTMLIVVAVIAAMLGFARLATF
jgi:hypothetical protein